MPQGLASVSGSQTHIGAHTRMFTQTHMHVQQVLHMLSTGQHTPNYTLKTKLRQPRAAWWAAASLQSMDQSRQGGYNVERCREPHSCVSARLCLRAAMLARGCDCARLYLCAPVFARAHDLELAIQHMVPTGAASQGKLQAPST